MKRLVVRRGEVYWFDFGPRVGSAPAGRRPALVVQWDVNNRTAATTIVAVLTSQGRRRAYPFHVPVTAAESGLELDSLVLCEQLQTVDQDNLQGPVAVLGPRVMGEVDAALRVSLGLEASSAS